MVLLVQKYGGGSLTDLSKLEYIARKIKKHRQLGYEIVVVLSAMAGETDRLIELARMVAPELQKKEYDQLLAVGEQTTVALMVMALERLGVSACSLNAWQAGIHSNNAYMRACITNIDENVIRKQLKRDCVPVVTGFQALGPENALTTLGRGGSDTTAVALAASLGADECQIFVDVNGIHTADPKIEPCARLLHTIDAQQMLSYACLGAKVMQKRAVAIAVKYQVPLRICPTFTEGPGTMITYREANHLHNIEEAMVTAVASARQYVVLYIMAEEGKPAELMLLLESLADSGLDIEHRIRQRAANTKSYQLDCLLSQDDYEVAKKYIDAWLTANEAREARVIRNMAKVSLLGYGLARDMATTHTLMRILNDAKIEYHHIAALDHQLAVVVDEKCLELLVRLLHQEFELSSAAVKKTKPTLEALVS